jgi:hypothetical protein
LGVSNAADKGKQVKNTTNAVTPASRLPIRAGVSLHISNCNTNHNSFMQRKGTTAVVPVIQTTVWSIKQRDKNANRDVLCKFGPNQGIRK